MRWTHVLTLAGLLTGGNLTAAESPLTEARDWIGQWVQTRQLISRTRSDGEASKEVLLQTRALHERELKSLDEALARSSTNSVHVTAEREKAERELAESSGALDGVRTVVDELEASVRLLLPLLPPPLLEQARPVVNRIPSGTNTTRAAVTERLQAVVTLLGEIDKFQQTVTVAPGRRPDGQGREVAVDTLYLGLGAAYYSDPTGEVAGVGVPGEDGWRWEAKPGIGRDVLAALAMYRNSRPAAFVALPLSLKP